MRRAPAGGGGKAPHWSAAAGARPIAARSHAARVGTGGYLQGQGREVRRDLQLCYSDSSVVVFDVFSDTLHRHVDILVDGHRYESFFTVGHRYCIM